MYRVVEATGMGVGGTQQPPRGIEKASDQLFLAAELTVDGDLARRLSDLAYEIHGLAETGRPDAAAVERVDAQLRTLREDTYAEVRDAIIRAQELLSAYRSPLA